MFQKSLADGTVEYWQENRWPLTVNTLNSPWPIPYSAKSPLGGNTFPLKLTNNRIQIGDSGLHEKDTGV